MKYYLLQAYLQSPEAKHNQRELAKAIGMYESHFSDLVNCKRTMTPLIAVKLEIATGTSAMDWMSQQMTMDLNKARLKRKLLQ